MKVPFTWKPTGWFMVGWSAEFPVGEVRPLHYFGEDLVAWRTDDGALQIMDAHCPHLGAHIGHHGKVHGDCVQCPYHGWTYGTDGVNRSIPYEDRPNLTKRLRVWSVVEQYDCVFLWHQPHGDGPRWEMPDIFTSFPSLDVDPANYYRPYPELSIKYEGEPVHPQIPLENGPDSVHFQYVHSASVTPVLLDWEMVDQEVHFRTGWPDARGEQSDAMALGIQSHFFGVGGAISAFEGAAQYRLVFATTPVDDERSDMFYSIWWPRVAGDDSPAPPPELRERIEKEFIVTLWDDLEIWRYQRYVEHPALAQQDAKPYGQLRKWARQFYEIAPDEIVEKAPACEHVVTTGLDPALEGWVVEVTGATRLTVHRGVGGASRAGHAIDAELPDGSVRELWLRSDPGFGPQSATLYSLPREAAVYRALGPTPMRVAALVAAHPTEPAFLMQRVEGASRFAQIADPAEQLAIARQFMDQLAVLHHLDPDGLELPELGAPGAIREHVLDEILEWESQYAAAGGGVPLITLAFAWLREHLPDDGGWPVVLVQGDTGPGNFMYADGQLVAITDWELAHWGDLHDDLAWILVRDTLERFPDLAAHLRDYEAASGYRIDPERLGYFRVLAQLRATIGTLAGMRSHDARGEIAWQLIYNTLHTRVLGESLAAVAGIPLPPPIPEDERGGPSAWVFDTALDDLRDVVVPALDDPFAATRAKGIARLLKYLRAVDGAGRVHDDAERAQLAGLLGIAVDDIDAGRRALCDAIAAGTVAPERALPYCLDQAARDTSLMRSAMGDLADRHITPVDQLTQGPLTKGTS